MLRSTDALLTGQLESLLASLPTPEVDALARALPFVKGRPRRDAPAAPSQAAAPSRPTAPSS